MKHEAFVDAVTMLDDDIIAEAQEPFRRKSHAKVIGFCSAAAACAAVIGAVLLLPGGNSVDILVMGRELSDSPIALSSGNSDADRAAISAYSLEPTDIPVSIDAHGLTVVTVYGGEIYKEGLTQPAETPLAITGSSVLVWSVTLWDSSREFTLTAQTGNHCRILRLSFDDSLQEWTFSESSR